MWSITKPVGGPERGVGASAMFARIAASIAADVRRGALRAGDRLPSTRELAQQLDLNRNTIVAAYDELIAQGWIVSRGAAGTFVSDEIPERAVRAGPTPPPHGMAVRPGFELRTVAPTPFAPAEIRYHLSAGVPDARLFPRPALARAYRRALQARSGLAALDYGDPRGSLRLRTAVATLLRSARGLPVTAEHICITRGSQMALDLVARLLVRPTDVVAVEELGYRPAWRAFEEAGARLAGIPLDASGIVVDQLAKFEPRCVYVTPHHQYPTTVLLSPARRLALLDLARRRRFAIIEDDYDHEFHFSGRPVAPLATTDAGGNVIYLGTLSKILAPGLRLGFVAASERVIEGLARLRTIADRQGDHVLEHAVAELIEDGELERHTSKARRIYEARRDAMIATLDRELPGVLSFVLPPGGVTLWARVDSGIKLEAWRQRALAHGVAITTARELDLETRSRPFVRLGFAHYDESELGDAVRRLRRALDEP